MAAQDRFTWKISLAGAIVIIGIILQFVWSFWGGLAIAVLGLVLFGGLRSGSR